jgi:hypothetical protein
MIETLMEEGFSELEARRLYKKSRLDVSLRCQPEFVLHYSIDYWVEYIKEKFC